jgi:hypothetical protein
MSPVLDIVVLLLVSDVEDRFHPPIVPPVAVMLLVLIVPVMFALVAVSEPVLVTLNGAVDAVEDPAKNGNEAGIIPTAVAPEPAVREVAPIVNPPICPEDADTAPVMSTPVAVKAPVLVTRNGAVDAVEPPSQSR